MVWLGAQSVARESADGVGHGRTLGSCANLARRETDGRPADGRHTSAATYLSVAVVRA
jgi:hypothetical protein